jgi:hypothetical protein
MGEWLKSPFAIRIPAAVRSAMASSEQGSGPVRRSRFAFPTGSFKYRTEEKRKEAERRQTHRQMPAPAGAGRATERRLAPPVRSRGALACRRSTAALAEANQRRRSAPAMRFLGRGLVQALPASTLSQSSDLLADRS